MEPQNCYICNNTSVFYSRNLFKTKSKYSETRICEFVRKFLGDYPSEQEYEETSCDGNNYCVCIECLSKIDEYDMASMTAKRVETELRNLLLHTEATLYREYKDPFIDDIFVSTIETIEKLEEEDYDSNDEIGEIEKISDIESDKANSASDEDYIPPGSKQLPHYLITKSEPNVNEGKRRKHKCNKCNMEFKSVSALARHKPAKSVSGSTDDVKSAIYKCKNCTEEFCTRSQHDHHKKQHKGEDGQFKCVFCSFDLKEQSALDEHVKLHTDLSPLHCVICKKPFKKKGGLVRHMRIHTLQFYQCHRCGKGFVHKSSFEMHLMAHDDIRKKKCPHCDQMFRSTSHLNRHLRIHKGSKPYSCPVSYNMGVHLRLHDTSSNQPKQDRKTYNCSFCNSSFARQSKLDDHLKKSHEAIIPHTNIGNSLENTN